MYVAHENYLDEVRSLFDGCNLGDIYFYPAVKAYTEALAVSLSKDFALVDMGASGINVILFRDGMLEYEARLPLGTHTIDTDIMLAFGINGSQARKLKHEYGQALRSNCKNKKIPIPDTKLTLESRDLSTVVQSRAEELLEGVAFLLQKWGLTTRKMKYCLPVAEAVYKMLNCFWGVFPDIRSEGLLPKGYKPPVRRYYGLLNTWWSWACCSVNLP